MLHMKPNVCRCEQWLWTAEMTFDLKVMVKIVLKNLSIWLVTPTFSDFSCSCFENWLFSVCR